MNGPRGDRQTWLDGLRGVAALYVVLHHMCLEVWPTGVLPQGRWLILDNWLLWGRFSVTAFIVLSGYCLTLPLVRRPDRPFSPELFLRRRAMRILPPYYLAFLFTAALVFTCIGDPTGTHWDVALPASPRRIAADLFLVPEFGTINHVFWSVGVECKIYLLFPLILFLQKRLGILSAGAAMCATFWLTYAMPQQYRIANPQYLAMFCWGSAAAYVANSQEAHWLRMRQSRLWLLLLAASAAATVFLCRRIGFRNEWLFLVDPWVGLGTVSTLVLAARSGSGAVRRVLNWKPLVFVGTFSYSLYLIHAPLIQAVWQYAINPITSSAAQEFLALVGFGLPAILICAWLFYFFCERPFVPRQQ